MSRILDISDGFESSTAPTIGAISAMGLTAFANDGAFVSAKGSAATDGDAYWNTTSDKPKYHDGSAWVFGVTQAVINFLLASQLNEFVDDAAFVTAKGSAAARGDIYINTTSNQVKFHNGTAWFEIMSSTGSQTFAGNKTFSNDVIISGDLTVNGTTTTVNTSNLDVTDPQITVNDGGNQATANAAVAGVRVEMSDATHAVLGYDSALASKFKAGEAGSEVEVATVSHSQTLTNKTIDDDTNTIQNLVVGAFKTVIGNAFKFFSFDVSGAPIATKTVPTGDVLGTSDVQAITLKDIDGGTASNTTRITVPKNTTANLNALTRKQGTILYDTDLNVLKVDSGAALFEVGSGAVAFAKENLTLSATNISNGYVDLLVEAQSGSLDVVFEGRVLTESVDYTLSVVSLKTRITFAGSYASLGDSALVENDILRCKYAEV